MGKVSDEIKIIEKSASERLNQIDEMRVKKRKMNENFINFERNRVVFPPFIKELFENNINAEKVIFEKKYIHVTFLPKIFFYQLCREVFVNFVRNVLSIWSKFFCQFGRKFSVNFVENFLSILSIFFCQFGRKFFVNFVETFFGENFIFIFAEKCFLCQ